MVGVVSFYGLYYPPLTFLQMHQFTRLSDVSFPQDLLNSAISFQQNPLTHLQLGEHKTLVLLFFNPSLRTRLSTQKAAINLGMSVMTMNAAQGWKLEMEENIVMNTDKAEHIKEAAAVISQYADLIGIRTFAAFQDREKDYHDEVLYTFAEYASVPIISLESAIRHPLQSLADWLTIEQYKKSDRPKVVLSWAPHPKSLPQAVANSFLEWMQFADVDLTVTHPPGYELAPSFIKDTPVIYDQKQAFADADFIYTKNWSSYQDYGRRLPGFEDWTINADKMAHTNNAFFMHCLPVRRNVVVADEVIDSAQSIVIPQSKNRLFAAQAVIKHLLAEVV